MLSIGRGGGDCCVGSFALFASHRLCVGVMTFAWKRYGTLIHTSLANEGEPHADL